MKKTIKKSSAPAEFKIVRLRDCPVDSPLIETPPQVEDFWHKHVVTAPWFKEDKECLCVFLLNTRHRLLGFELVSQGNLDTVLMHPRDVFRLASIRNAAAIVIAHNHPSGDPAPSADDIKITVDLIRAAAMMKIELVDHVIIGDAMGEPYCSLRGLGYFSADPPAGDAKKASFDSLTELEMAKAQSNALLQLLCYNMEYQSRNGCEFSGASVEAFCGGISELTRITKERLSKAFDDTFSAIHPKREAVAAGAN